MLSHSQKNLLVKILGCVFHSKGYYRMHNDLNGRNKKVIIEIIGPAGVGKSTFINQVKKKGLISRYKVPKFNIRDAFKSKDLDFDFHAKLFGLKVKNELPGGKGLHRFQDMLLWLFRDQYLHITNNRGKLFLVDEGLGHHFTSELIEAHNADPGLFEAVVDKRCFVALKSTPEIIAGRIMGRKKAKGQILPYHDGLTAKQLEAYLSHRMANIECLMNLAKNAGVPCLTINTDDDKKQQLLDFESFLQNLI